VEANQIKKSDKEKHQKLTQYCNICRGEFDVIVFKDHCICEECVEYIKVNFKLRPTCIRL
jgi:hypothetical protein